MSVKLFPSSVPESTYPVDDIGAYSDGTPMVKGYINPLVDSMVVQPTSLNEFVTAMFLVDSLNERGRKVKNLILPYVPGARQDRINPSGDLLFTAKSVAKMINERGFDRVTIVDPHSPVIAALIDRSDVYPLTRVMETFHRDVQTETYTGIIAPDVGAIKRAEEVAAVFGLPVYQGFKHRDVSTGKLSRFSVNLDGIENGHFLVVDDICDGGGTFEGLGEVIRNSINSADLYVTHGIFSKGVDGLKKYFKNVYATDSYLGNLEGATVIPVAFKMRSN